MNNLSKINLYKKLYDKDSSYERNLMPMYKTINSCINFKIESFLDYGCGKSNLSEIMLSKKNIKTYKYDPAIKEFSKLDKSLKVDLVANCDVMEHIPEHEIDQLLENISKISNNIFFNIYLKEAETILPNGENAHCTVKPKYWWRKKIKKYFHNITIIPTTYKNSVTIITWKIDVLNYFKILYVNITIIIEYFIWLIRTKIFNKK